MNLREAQRAAVTAAQAVGHVMRKNRHAAKKVNAETSHDIKLELDVRCQKLIEKSLHVAFPQVSLLGEEGTAGEPEAPFRWVVDPIDGTVNFAHDIPHASVSIALQQQKPLQSSPTKRRNSNEEDYQTVVGVVYDPFTEELWSAVRGESARLNGKTIHVSQCRTLDKCIASIGFAKDRTSLERALPYFIWLARRVRKIRMMGSAALALTYVASGRFDAYVERGINLWDIAAGGLILECAGGKFWREPVPGGVKFRMMASNGLLHKRLLVPR